MPPPLQRHRVATPLTTDILERIDSLLRHRGRGPPPDVRLAAQQNRTTQLVDALHEIIDAALRRLSPKPDMAKAIAYATKRWPALFSDIDDGRLEIDTTIAERALRSVAARNDLHRHPDLQGQWRRPAGLHRRHYSEGRS